MFTTNNESRKENEVFSPPTGSLSPNTITKFLGGLTAQDKDADQYNLAKAMVHKIQEEEKRKNEERKRRREEQEKWERAMKRKLTEEEEKLKTLENLANKNNTLLYKLFNDLQGVSHDFNLSLDAPELVVVGMQSDGKSSFIEALLSFQFNIVESSIGTRRPLIIQMINDPDKKQPYCRFRKEEVQPKSSKGEELNKKSSSSGISVEEDLFEKEVVPVSKLCDEICRRTNEIAGTSDDCVSSKPIILRVEYYLCANLTIYDTPGFRLRGDEKLKSEIEEMVIEIMKPQHRLIICLEQSTVEWANTNSRPIVQRVDPNFERTILVNTKFDNRVKELRNSASANKYLSGENLPQGKKPFFISLPVKRDLSPERFLEEMRKCYLEDYNNLLSVNFDEKLHIETLGFFRLRKCLEKLLTDKYHSSIIPTLQALDNVVRKTQLEIESIKKELQTNTIENLKSKSSHFLQNFILIIERLLEGSIIGNPNLFGQTLTEERKHCNVSIWSNFEIDYEIENEEHKLYGGAQYARLLNEFEFVGHSMEFPSTSIHEVASALGNLKSHNMPSFESAASDIVQIKSKKVLLPLIEVVLQRTCYIMKRLFTIAVEVIKAGEDQIVENNCALLASYDLFVADLQKTFCDFVDLTEKDCKVKLIEDFSTFTKIVDWDLLNGIESIKEYSHLVTPPEDTKIRVQNLMNGNKKSNSVSSSPSHDSTPEENKKNMELELAFLRTRKIDQSSYVHICKLSSKLFAGIRFFFVKYIRNKLNAFFLDPMYSKLPSFLSEHFRKLTNETYEKMFDLGIKDLQNRLILLQKQFVQCKQNRDKFKAMCDTLRKHNV